LIATADLQHIYNLLLTTDLDILESALSVLLRPAQQYTSQTPFEPGQGPRLSHRLLTLARGWEKFHSRGLDLATLASANEVHLPDDLRQVQIQFYPALEAQSRQTSSSQPDWSPQTQPRNVLANGPVTLDLGDMVKTYEGDLRDRLTILAEENTMPADDQLVALNKLRLLVMVKDREKRRQLLTIRLLASAIYGELENAPRADVLSLPHYGRSCPLDAAHVRARPPHPDRRATATVPRYRR